MSGGACLVAMYHYVRDTASTPFPAIRALAPDAFEQQLDWLQSRYRVIDVADLESALDGRAPLPADAALLTFDDGFVDHHATVFPILARRGVTGVFFLAHDTGRPAPRVLGVHKTHFLLARLGADAFARAVWEECDAVVAGRSPQRSRVFGADRWEHAGERAVKDLLNYELPFDVADRVLSALFERHIGGEAAFARELYLSEEMIAEMAAAGMTFGSHTRSHRMLSRLTVDEQASELRDGVSWIRGLTGQTSVPFCYPWGGPKTYTADTLRILDETGYSLAFNTVRRAAVVGRDHRFELPRIDTRDLPPHTEGPIEVPVGATEGGDA
jgi:peptidoglycan/xylan/chitin deacetylase (PgdA/CDA1 family)